MIKEYLIILLSSMLIIGFIYLLYATGILKRKVLVTTIVNLPINIFKENKSQIQEATLETYIQENSQRDENKLVKCTNENIKNESKHDLKNEFIPEALEILEETNVQNKDIVYWTPQGKYYHKTQHCGALLRSKVIHSGSVEESGKLTSCHKCNKFKTLKEDLDKS